MYTLDWPLRRSLSIHTRKPAGRWSRVNLDLHPDGVARSAYLTVSHNGPRPRGLGVPGERRQLEVRPAERGGATRDCVPPGLEEVWFSYRQRRAAGREARPPLTIDARRKLYEYFADALAQLEKMIGRDLSMWEPEGGS